MTASKQPSVRQMIAVQLVLDQFFDIEKGRYYNGYDDERVSAETQVPRIFVEQIRLEGGWGPIKSDPEVESLRTDIETARSTLRDLDTRLQRLEAKTAKVGLKPVI